MSLAAFKTYARAYFEADPTVNARLEINVVIGLRE